MTYTKFDCCVCGRNLMANSGQVLAAHLAVGLPNDSINQEVYPDLKLGEQYIVCFVCALRSMRVRV